MTNVWQPIALVVTTLNAVYAFLVPSDSRVLVVMAVQALLVLVALTQMEDK